MFHPTIDRAILRERLTGPSARRAFQRHRVVLAYLHGSWALNTAYPWSDVDTAVLLPPDVTRDKAIELRRSLFVEIEKLLHTDAIHLSILNDASPLFCYQVINCGGVIYAEDEQSRINFEARTYSRYFYEQPFYGVRRQYLANKMKGSTGVEGRAMIDKETISERLDALDDYLNKLESLKPVSLQDLHSNFRLRWEVERGLELACNCVLDITNHIVAALRLGVPRDQTEALRLLASAPEIVPAELVSRLNGLPGFRNVLAHEYLTIDLEEVHRVLHEDLADLRAFAQHIHTFLSS